MKRPLKLTLAIISLTVLLLTSTLITFAQPAEQTVEGSGNYFVTGESYPTQIRLVGYNSRDNKLYLNLQLETTKTVATGQVVTFNYFVDIFNDSAVALGNLGSYDTPEQISGSAGQQTVSVTNKEITLSGNLTAEYRIVAQVKSTTIA